MRITNYTLEWYGTDEVESGSVERLLLEIRKLKLRSGGCHVPRTAKIIAVQSPSARIITFQVYFDPRAWTG